MLKKLAFDLGIGSDDAFQQIPIDTEIGGFVGTDVPGVFRLPFSEERDDSYVPTRWLGGLCGGDGRSLSRVLLGMP